MSDNSSRTALSTSSRTALSTSSRSALFKSTSALSKSTSELSTSSRSALSKSTSGKRSLGLINLKGEKEKDPPGVLTIHKILQKHLFKKQEEINESEFLFKLKRARLDRLNLLEIEDGMKSLYNITHLYLQHVSFSMIY